MGGLINGATVKGDLWMIEAGGNMTCYPLPTTAEGPGPRVGHSSLLVGNAFIVFGGDTKIEESDMLDETLYLLNTCTVYLPPFWPVLRPPTLRLSCEPPADLWALMISNETMVASPTVWNPTCRAVWPLAQYRWVEDLHIWWPGGRVLHERHVRL